MYLCINLHETVRLAAQEVYQYVNQYVVIDGTESGSHYAGVPFQAEAGHEV